MATPTTPPRLTQKQRAEADRARREAIRAQAERARAARLAPQAQAEPATVAWTFEDEESVGADVLSPTALEFVLNLLESVAPGAVNAPNRALLDVTRTKIRRGVARGHGALLLSTEAPEAPAHEPAPAPTAGTLLARQQGDPSTEAAG